MIKKINDNAYFNVDLSSFCASITHYDSVLANQTISVRESEENIIPQTKEIMEEEIKESSGRTLMFSRV